MNNLLRLKAIPTAACLALLPLLAGCFETKQEFTLNPDGSGKVVHESKFQTMDLSGGGQKSSEKQVKAAVAEILKQSKGVEAWRDVSYELLPDGRIAFKGTAYFRNLSDFNIPNQTMLEFDWTHEPNGTGVLTLREKSGASPNKKASATEKLSPDELAQKLKEARAQYQQAKPMMTMIMGAMKHEVVFHLPGKRGQTTAFKADPTGGLRLQFDGGKLLEAMEKLINDDAWLAQNASSLKPQDEGPQMDERMGELMFGEKGPVRAAVSGLAGAAFDYEAELAAAKEDFAALQQQLGPVAGAVAPPAKGGELKSLKVVGVRLVRPVDEALEIRPFSEGPGYTVALLAELPGSVHAISDESGLDSAVASDGSNLLPESEFSRRFSFPKLSADKASVLLEASLTSPGPDVTGIKELTGHLRYTVAAGTVETDLGLAKMAADAKGKAHGAEVKSLSDKSDEGSQTMELQLDLEPDTVKAAYVLIGREKIELSQRGYGGGGGTYVFTYESPKGFPAKSKVIVETYAQMETYDTPFKLENITLLGEPASK
ncbi:MAG TPA: hypothetical protein VG734_00520 [Lacunisphaera sp.]|nr:hypothetical protein [Lacunisphaera sp.]